MSTKAEITTKINTNLASASSITAEEHREVLHTEPESFLENIYATPITDTNATTTVFTLSGAGKNYRFRILKQGRKVIANGSITNTTGSTTAPSTEWLTITNTEYQQESYLYFFNGVSSVDGSSVRLSLFGNSLVALSPVGNGESIYFTISYNTLS